MTSDRRRAANRANAARSTGPRTPAGKARAADNARRHGLAAAAPVAGADTQTARLAAAYHRLLGDTAAAQRAADAHVHLLRVKAAKLGALQRALLALKAQAPATGPKELEAGALLQAYPELRKLGDYERKARSRLKAALRAP